MLSDIKKTEDLSQNIPNWSRVLLYWDRYTSPFRLSPKDVENYSLILKRLKKKKSILLLGSTPEIREILAKQDSFIMIADSSFRMISGMLVFGPLINESKETWVRASWMDLDKFLKNNYFDVIVGDLFLRNIDLELQNKCLRKISKLLKKDGYLITRVHSLNEKLINLSSTEIIKLVFEEYKHKRIKEELIEDLIASRLFDKNTDFGSKKVNKKAFLNDIKKYKKSARNKKEKSVLNNILEKWDGERTWVQRTSKEIDKLLSRYFIIHDIKTVDDYEDSKFYPIYILKNSRNKK